MIAHTTYLHPNHLILVFILLMRRVLMQFGFSSNQIQTLGLSSVTDRYKHPAPHATSGVIGNDANIDKAKIEPLEGQTPKGGEKPSGLTDEEIDAARVQPLGEVREEM